MSKIELIRVQTAGSEKTVSFSDNDLNDITTAREIGWQLAQILGDEQSVVDVETDALQPRLHIDFKNISRLNSAGLNGLIGMNAQARNHGVQLVLKDVQDNVRDVFVVTRLERMFEFSKSEAISENADVNI